MHTIKGVNARVVVLSPGAGFFGAALTHRCELAAFGCVSWGCSKLLCCPAFLGS